MDSYVKGRCRNCGRIVDMYDECDCQSKEVEDEPILKTRKSFAEGEGNTRI